jgi:membrane-associated protease RseP (regulator of RpoE activity)
LLLNVPAGSPAARAGFQKDDVILACNGQPVRTLKNLLELRDQAAGRPLSVSVNRKQTRVTGEVTDYVYVVAEYQPTPDFKFIRLMPSAGVLPAKLVAGEPSTSNEPMDILTDGKLAKNYGPVFPNGVTDGMYKLDLGAVKSIGEVDSFSYNQNNNRGLQRFALYGSSAVFDPGWKVEDARLFTPLVDLDTGEPAPADFVATGIRCSGGRPLGNYRWLVWAIAPTTEDNLENTAFQELQVIPASGDEK